MRSSQLDSLIIRGRQLLDAFAGDPSSLSALEEARIWQQECGVAVSRLSGGRKSHWLARAYSDAFLVRPAPDRFVQEAALADIVDRTLRVLERAAMALSQMDYEVFIRSPEAERHTPRFDFVHDREIRPVLEQAYADSRDALERGDFRRSLILSCSVLEAILTDALANLGQREQAKSLSESSFDARISAAERAALVSGCARLPPIARRYRDLAGAAGELGPEVKVSEREARLTGQVLHVVMRDLNPGR